MSPSAFSPTSTYSELSLGPESQGTLLKHLFAGIGYGYSGPATIPGLSGLRHSFSAIGTKSNNILLAVGGREEDRPKGLDRDSPRALMEAWRDRALLSAYDVQGALERDGLVVDLMFFQNVNQGQNWFRTGMHPLEWARKNHLPDDIGLRFTESVFQIPVMPSEELAIVAQSVGASFLSLGDLRLDEIAMLTTKGEGVVPHDKIKDVLSRRRILQYFYPPTDELILSAYDISKRDDKGLVTELKESAEAIGHPPVRNVIFPQANFLDPVQTAQELERSKYISFESKVQITESGFTITQSIRKTAQGSLVLRVLKRLGISNLAKTIIEAARRA